MSIAALILVCLIWGATFVLVKKALDDISTLLFLTLRFVFATTALSLMWGRWLFRLPAKTLKPGLRGGLIAGICLFSGYVLQTFGLKYTTAAKAGFLTGLYIPLVPLFSAVVYREIPGVAELLGVGCAFVGMALLTVQHDSFSIGFGDSLVIACAVAYAFHILVLGHFAPRVNVPVLTVAQIGTAALLGGSTFWWVESPRVRWTPEVWAAVGVTSILATALAFAVQTWAQKYTSPARTALIFSLEPVFAWATSYLVVGEVLNSRGVVGAILILGGILLVELKPPRSR